MTIFELELEIEQLRQSLQYMEQIVQGGFAGQAFLANSSSGSSGGSGSPAGSDTQVQYNSAGSFAGSAGLTIDASGNPIVTGNNAASEASLLLNGALFSGGSGTTNFPFAFIQPSGATISTSWNTGGTVLGINAPTFTGNLVDLKVNGSTVMLISSGGSIFTTGNVTAGSGGVLSFNGRSNITSSSNGILTLNNNAQTAFTQLQFGGTTGSFPSIKVNATALNFRLADDSADAAITAAAITASSTITSLGSIFAGVANTFSWSGRSKLSSPSDGVITLANSASSGFTRLQFGGITSSFPSLRVTGASLNVRLADDSADANLTAGIFNASASITSLSSIAAGFSNSYSWTTRSKMASAADGNIIFTNQAGTSFNLLQFGTTTSSSAAIKSNGAALNFRLADDSADANITAAGFFASSFQRGNRTTVSDTGYVVLASDYIVAYTSLTTTRAVTLPTPSTPGRILIIKDEAGTAGTNAITFTGTIDGATNKSINANYGSMRLYDNGTTWSGW